MVSILEDSIENEIDDLEEQAEDSTSDSANEQTTGNDDNDKKQTTTQATQRRRRVTRACDECRRKKIKCDGKQSCKHCTIYSYECTYDQPSHRRRNPAPQYIESLERRLARAEAIIQVYLPSLNVNDPNLDYTLMNHGTLPIQPTSGSGTQNMDDSFQQSQSWDNQNTNEPDIESMVTATGLLTINGQGNWHYHGQSSGLSFVRHMGYQFSDLESPEQTDEQPRTRIIRGDVVNMSVPGPGTPLEGTRPGIDGVGMQSSTRGLPQRDTALRLCKDVLEDGTAMLVVVHNPTFYGQLDRIYDMPSESYTAEDHRFLPLLYAVLAFGSVRSSNTSSKSSPSLKDPVGTGYHYFMCCRQQMDIMECQDLTSLQAIVYMMAFLSNLAKLSSCYMYLGVAVRSALRMGLHRSFKDHFSPIEAESRKRLFWTIRGFDVRIAAMLGLPQALKNEDIDQEYPTEVNDCYIRPEGIFQMPHGEFAKVTAVNAHTHLTEILARVLQKIYPAEGLSKADGCTKSHSVSCKVIRELEMDLQSWYKTLPEILKSGDEKSHEMDQIRHSLRLIYACVQMTLYRPFLHYASPNHSSEKNSQGAYACAVACINISRNVIHIITEMKRQKSPCCTHWFPIFTAFYSILSLFFYALENPESADKTVVLQDAWKGRDTLENLANCSVATDRCNKILSGLLVRLGDNINVQQQSRVNRRKRSSPLYDAEPQKLVNPSSYPSDGLLGSSGLHQPCLNQGGKQSRRKQRMRVLTGNQQQHSPSSQQPKRVRPSSMYMSPLDNASPSSSIDFGTPGDSFNYTVPYYPSSYPDSRYPNALSNFSSTLFPQGQDLFAYPNPPMTTLEHHFPFTQGVNDYYPTPQSATGPSQPILPASNPNVLCARAEEQIDVPLFPSASYITERQDQAGSMSPYTQSSLRMSQTQAPTPVDTPELLQQSSLGAHGLGVMNIDPLYLS